MKKILFSLCFFSIYALFADNQILTPKNLTESEIAPMMQNGLDANGSEFANNQNDQQELANINQEFNETQNNNQMLPNDNIPNYNQARNMISNDVQPINKELVQNKIIANKRPNRKLVQANACPPVCAPACSRRKRLRSCKPKCIVPRVICCPKAKPTVCREPLPFCCQPPRVRCCKIRKVCFPRPLRCCPQPIRCIPKAGICPIAKPKCPNGVSTCETCYNPIQYSCSADSGSLIAPGQGMIPQRRNRDVAYVRPIELYREAMQDIRQEQDMENSVFAKGMSGGQGDLTNQQDIGANKEISEQLA